MIKSVMLFIALSVAAISADSYLGSVKCPEDGCMMYYTGQDDWCVGTRCRHVAYYRCGCCNETYKVYVD